MSFDATFQGREGKKTGKQTNSQRFIRCLQTWTFGLFFFFFEGGGI